MLSRNILRALAVLVNGASCARQHFPRATARNLNATITSDAYPSIPTCCYIDSFGVGLVLWYTGSVEVTVATVSTIVYQYDNTAVTSYKTIKANSTQSLPTGLFNNFGTDTISGVPTDIIGSGLGGYEADTTLIAGTEFTDPYGVVYTSPTPVWVFGEITYFTQTPEPTGTGYACPSPNAGGFGEGLDVYPSGFYLADDDTMYGQNNTGEIFVPLPEQLKDWVVSHVPPNTDTLYSELAQCTLAFGDGIPVAHVPVTELTAGVTTTTTLTGNFGVPTQASTTPESEIQTTSTPTGETSSTYLPSESTPPAISNPVSTSSPGVPSASSTAPGEVASSGSRSGTTAGESPGDVRTSSAGGIVASRSSSPIIGASSGNSGPGSTAAGGGVNGGSQTTAGAGSQTSSAGNGNGRGSQSSAAGNGNAGGSQTTNTGGGSGGSGNTITTFPPSSTVAPVFTAGGITYTGNSASGFIIGSSTLKPGGTVIISGSGTASPITYILPTSGSAIIINGATETLSSKTVAAATATPILVIGSSTYTANSASEYVIGSQILTAGGVITASGETLSLESGGKTVVVVSGTSTQTESLGGIIASFGGFSPTTAGPAYVTASKAGLSKVMDVWILGVAFGMGLVGVVMI
ncbi:uncharacterized protein PAC_11548 [Phialocephala subalpina]|uniref:Uncharacterized protein n=1 Tax=Phialocephala subalpina TaxID=576137 RepID=A0A1L7X9F0_9HELO|nr:uncharacterized protein PAC_11548 [Phialocephala subalpina]